MSHKAKKMVVQARWILIPIGCLVVLGGILVAGEMGYARMYDGRIYPGVRVLNVDIGGLPQEQAREVVLKAIDQALAQGLHFQFRDQKVKIDAVAQGINGPDATRDLVRYASEPTIDSAIEFGRHGSWVMDVLEQARARIHPVALPVSVTLDEPALEDALTNAFKEQLQPAQDAVFSVALSEGAPLLHIEPEHDGYSFQVSRAFAELKTQAEHLRFAQIVLQEERAKPRVRRDDLEPLSDEALAFVQRPPLVFTYQDQSFVISTSTFVTWMMVSQDTGKAHIAIDEEAFGASLRKAIPNVEQEVKNGSLDIQDGKIVSFIPGSQGRAIDVKTTLADVEKRWPKERTFPLVVELTSGALLGEDPEELGIKEIIGVGTSNFSGSPANRLKNIRLGAERVNGTLIAPGEEFSLLKTLGKVDGEHGWLPELVIKGDRTIPEFGGGLCQIGTTTFRGALNSGLKITQRQNHSYRVRYYEPAGTDATIYEPAPDFRFMNDTGHHVLIHAYVKGNDAYFEFWGTKDGRKVDPIKPRVYNVTSPPPTKLVETLDLKPGVKKCTETAHAGADAEFTYTVTYGDGTKHQEVFTSHYRPWQAVCLVGVEKLSEPIVEGAASSTGEVVN